MREAVARSFELALRATALPLLLGLRWSRSTAGGLPAGLPRLAGGLALAAKGALDEFFYATELVSASYVSLRDQPRVAREIEVALALFEERGWLEDATGYHPRPPGLHAVTLESRGLAWRNYGHLRFESGYSPHPGEPGRERWLAHAANRVAHAWVLRHPGRVRPWLVCVPGYRMGHPLVDFTAFRARWLHEQLGLNVAIPVMPLHGPRRVGRRGGDGFFSGDFLDTVHAQSQAVWDVRRLVGWLQDQGAPAIGLYGISLGGFTTALVAALEDDLDCVVAGVPASDFARLLRDHTPELVQRVAAWLGVDFERMAQVLQVVSPLALAPRVPHEHRYIYAGLGDRLATPHHSEALWIHWGKPAVAWYQGGHVSFLWEQEVFDFLHAALRRSLLAEAR